MSREYETVTSDAAGLLKIAANVGRLANDVSREPTAYRMAGKSSTGLTRSIQALPSTIQIMMASRIFKNISMAQILATRTQMGMA